MKRARRARAPEAAAPPPPRELRPWAIWTVAAVALALRLVVVAQLHDHPLLQPRGVLDDAEYFRLGQRAAAGDWLLGPRAYHVSPLYIYFLAIVFRVSGAVPLHAQVVQAALGAAAVLLVGRAAGRLFGARAGVIASVLAAATGVLVFNEALLLQSSIDPFLAALALERLSAALVTPSAGRHLAAGLAFGLLGLNRPNALAALAVVAAVALVTARSRRAAAHALVLALGGALAVAPVAVRNRVVAGEWIAVSTHGGLNFNIGNHPRADGAYGSPPGITPSIQGQAADMRRVAEAAAGRALTDSEVSAHYYREGWKWIRAEPGAAARLFARKVVLAFHSVELPLNYAYAYWSRDEPTLLRFLAVGPWLLVPLGLAGLFAPPSAGRRAALVWAAFVPAYALAVAAFFVASRYRLPMVVALCVSAGAAIDWLWRAAASRARPAGWRLMAAGGALGLALAHWPLAADDGRAFERTERIVHLVAEGRGDEARALFDRTLPLHPDAGLLQYRMGRAWLDAGQPALAVPHFDAALAIVPGQGEVHLVQGQALLRLGRAAEALPHLEKARAGGAFADVAGLELARALASVGRNEEARVVVAATPTLEDTDAPTAAELGGAALSLGDAATAARFFEDAIRRAPDMAAAHESLGLALASLGRTPEAIASLEAACRLAPGDPTAPYNLALLYARVGRRADAVRLAERARDLDPSSPHPRKLLEALSAR